MDRYITRSKYFSADFNTAIFSDPIRIYFSNDQESQALELYFRLQSRKQQWEKFLRQRGPENYCYIMMYSQPEQYQTCFADNDEGFAPADMGEDFVVGINGPMTAEKVDRFFSDMDRTIGFVAPTPNL
jgi:hypothetical protein